MRLRSQHHFCIWCGKDLDQAGRSDEHIIPQSIFGNVITDDLCTPCNNRLGAELDHAFLDDGTTLTTAFAASVQPEELLSHYRARQSNEQGLIIETSIRRGVSAVIPQLDRADGPLIGDRAGVFDRNQIRGMKRITIARARARRPDLPPGEVERRVEALYEQFFLPDSPEVLYDSEIGEGLRRIVVESQPSLR